MGHSSCGAFMTMFLSPTSDPRKATQYRTVNAGQPFLLLPKHGFSVRDHFCACRDTDFYLLHVLLNGHLASYHVYTGAQRPAGNRLPAPQGGGDPRAPAERPACTYNYAPERSKFRRYSATCPAPALHCRRRQKLFFTVGNRIFSRFRAHGEPTGKLWRPTAPISSITAHLLSPKPIVHSR